MDVPEDTSGWYLIKLNHCFFQEFIPVVLKRRANCNIDVFEVLKNMMTYFQLRDAPNIEECFGKTPEETVKRFYLHFGVLVKFLYPIIEQLNETVARNVEIEPAKPSDFTT